MRWSSCRCKYPTQLLCNPRGRRDGSYAIPRRRWCSTQDASWPGWWSDRRASCRRSGRRCWPTRCRAAKRNSAAWSKWRSKPSESCPWSSRAASLAPQSSRWASQQSSIWRGVNGTRLVQISLAAPRLSLTSSGTLQRDPAQCRSYRSVCPCSQHRDASCRAANPCGRRRSHDASCGDRRVCRWTCDAHDDRVSTPRCCSGRRATGTAWGKRAAAALPCTTCVTTDDARPPWYPDPPGS